MDTIDKLNVVSMLQDSTLQEAGHWPTPDDITDQQAEAAMAWDRAWLRVKELREVLANDLSPESNPIRRDHNLLELLEALDELEKLEEAGA